MTHNLPTKERENALEIAGPLARAIYRWEHVKEKGTWLRADYSLLESLRRELNRINKTNPINPKSKSKQKQRRKYAKFL